LKKQSFLFAYFCKTKQKMQSIINTDAFLSAKQANWVSNIINPVFIPTFATAILMLSLEGEALPDEARDIELFLLVACFTTILPMILVLCLYWQGKLSTLNMYHRTERHIPLIASTLFVSYVAFIVSKNWNSGILGNCLIATSICLFVMIFVTRFHKASMHSAGVCGLIAVLLSAQIVYKAEGIFWITVICMFLAILTMLARLRLKAHTLIEVISGAMIGFSTYSIVLYLLN
jgi:membrane-associated phospholipid phosphatase